MRRLLFVLPVIACLLALYSGAVFANGTPSTTSISNVATIDAANTAPLNSNAAGATVAAIYGVKLLTDPVDGTITAGGTKDYSFEVSNPGNVAAGQNIGINVGAILNSGASAGTVASWIARVDDAAAYTTALIWDGTNDYALQAGDQATGAWAPLAPDASAWYTFRITAAGDALDTGWTDFPVKFVVTANGGVSSQYTGENAVVYSGPKEAFRNVGGGGNGVTYLRTTVQGPVLALVKSATVDSSGMVGYSGGLTDPVPGAFINYEVQFSNGGTAAATTVTIDDPFDANVTFVAGSIQSCMTGGVGCGLVADPDANAGVDDCWLNGVTGISCDIVSLGAADGGRFTYQVTID